MKRILFSFAVIIMTFALPGIVQAQTDTSAAKKVDSTATTAIKDSLATDTVAVTKAADTVTMVTTPMNCYKQWLDVFADRGVKPLTDGTQEVIIAFKSKESCHCYMGKVDVVGGKIKAPLYVQTEGGTYKTFVDVGKKLDPEFLAVQGEALWNITNGMSVLFQTVDQEYGRIFFYKSLNKNKLANKEAPSPSDLLK